MYTRGMPSLFAVSEPLSRFSACPGIHAPASFLLSDAMITAHFPSILPSPFKIPVVPSGFSSGLNIVFRGHQVPSSISSSILCFAVI